MNTHNNDSLHCCSNSYFFQIKTSSHEQTPLLTAASR
jgi:hypothetical protein